MFALDAIPSNLSNIAFVITPATEVDAAPIATLSPSDEFIVTFVSDVDLDKLVDTLWLISLVLAVFASISSNKPGDKRPDTDVVAIGIIALVPSEEVIVLAPLVPVILKSVDTFVTLSLFAVMCPAWVEVIPVLAVFASISSNNDGDKRPETLVVAKGITALLPSEDVIVLAPVVPLIPKSVDTLWLISLVLAVFAVIADACPLDIVVTELAK